MYPCEIAERAEERRAAGRGLPPGLAEPEPDWYEQQLLDEEEADHRRRVADAENEIAERERAEAGVEGGTCAQTSMRCPCAPVPTGGS